MELGAVGVLDWCDTERRSACSLCVASARPSAFGRQPTCTINLHASQLFREQASFRFLRSPLSVPMWFRPYSSGACGSVAAISCPCRLSNVIRSWKYTLDFVCMWCAIFLSRKKLGCQSDRGRHVLCIHTGVILVRITTNPGVADFFSQLGMSVRRLEQR